MANKSYPKVVKFIPKNLEKYIGDPTEIESRSSWELKLMRFCDTNSAVIKWSSETIKIPYISTCEVDERGFQKQRMYHMDFFIYYKTNDGNTRKLLVEVKPYCQTIPPVRRGRKKLETFLNEQKTYQINQDKWKAAEKYAKSMGWGFVIMTEYQLYPEKAKKGPPKARSPKK